MALRRKIMVQPKVSDGDLSDRIGDLRMQIAKLEIEEREARFELITRKSISQTGTRWAGEFIGEGPLITRRYVVSAAPKGGGRVGRKMLI